MVVYLVGVSSETDLLTVRGVSRVTNADAIIYTQLPNVLDVVRLIKKHDCEIVDAARQERQSQRKLVKKNLESLSKRYNNVIRLFHGDPLSSIEGADEVEFLAKKKIPFEIVPGVSRLFSAFSMAGLSPLAESNQDFAIVSSLETDKIKTSFKRYPEFVAISAGNSTQEITNQLFHERKIGKGRKFAVIRDYGTLDQLIELHEARDLGKITIWPRDLVVIGPNIERFHDLSWFEAKKKALNNQKLGYLWPGKRSNKISVFLESLGAVAVDVPLVIAESLELRLPVLERFDSFVFPNAEVIKEFFSRVEVPRDKMFFAIGPEAQYALEQQGIAAKIPVSYTPRGLASLVSSSQSARDRILVISNSNSPDTLRESLSAGHIVWEIHPYEVKLVETSPDFGSCTALIVDSISVVEPLAKHWDQVGDEKIVVSAGPTITREMFTHGLTPTLESKNPSPIRIIYSLMDYLYREGKLRQ